MLQLFLLPYFESVNKNGIVDIQQFYNIPETFAKFYIIYCNSHSVVSHIYAPGADNFFWFMDCSDLQWKSNLTQLRFIRRPTIGTERL